MLLRVDLSTGRVDGTSVSAHDLGSAGRLYFSGHCRLDNRRELLGRLQLSQYVSDAELIVHAYMAFGESHPEALLGDFAYALFDGRERRLWLVRDHMGVVPLYYHRAGDLCIASPSLDTLLDQPEIPRDLDDAVVAEWCVNGHVYNQNDTFYSAIKKVPSATQLCLGANTTVSRNYWSPTDIMPNQETREPVLVEQLRGLIETAILDRLGSDGGQAAHLSGGLDSTPIAIIAGRACRRHSQEFHSYNWCRPEASDVDNRHEWADARQVAREEGFIHREISPTPDTLLEDLLHHDLGRDGTTMFSYERHVVRQARADGVARIFSGFGGDEILTFRWRDRHYQALRAGRFLEVWRRLAMESDLTRCASLPRLGRRYARLLQNAWGFTPPAWLSPLRYQQSKVRFRLGLLQPEFAAYAVGLSHENSPVFTSKSITGQQIAYLGRGYHQERMESWALQGRRQGIDYVYPYLDKRLAEFALALPSEWYFRQGQDRYLYRRAVDHCLPETITTKGKPREIGRVRQLMKNYKTATQHPRVAERIAATSSPYLDARSLLSQLNRLRKADVMPWEQQVQELSAVFDALLALNLLDQRYRSRA
jgi:asparagine synthase (glutamine-hydrolysing)